MRLRRRIALSDHRDRAIPFTKRGQASQLQTHYGILESLFNLGQVLCIHVEVLCLFQGLEATGPGSCNIFEEESAFLCLLGMNFESPQNDDTRVLGPSA